MTDPESELRRRIARLAGPRRDAVLAHLGLGAGSAEQGFRDQLRLELSLDLKRQQARKGGPHRPH